MQLNNHKSSTSNTIKQNEMANKKARRRLIGSVVLLFTALIILLNVTTKVKPIPVNPKVIEISNNTSQSIIKPTASTPLTAISSAPTANPQIKLGASNSIAKDNSKPEASGFKAVVVNREEHSSKANEPENTKPKLNITPKIISQTTGHKPSPEDILNGNTGETTKNVYFIQIAASQNKEGLEELKQKLAQDEIKSFIQSTKNSIYRLRVGPFANKDDAAKKLAQIQNSLN